MRSIQLQKILRTIAACGLVTMGITGCTSPHDYFQNGLKVGPNYVTPDAPVAPKWIDSASSQIKAGNDDLSKWWTVFNDPVLNALICDASRQNLTLRQAGYRILQARAQAGIAFGQFFPQQQFASGSFTQNGLSKEAANRSFIPQRFYGQWEYNFGLAWELDFWGQFRRSIEAADDQLEASVQAYDQVLVSLLGDVASSYVQLRTLEQQLANLKKNVELQNKTLSIAKAKFDGGLVSELDKDQAQSNLSQIEAQIPQVEINIRLANNRLCVLMGMSPEDLGKRLGQGAIPTSPVDVIVGIPADLLRRRPDVRQQERLAAALSEQIGIAEAGFYPAISIIGNVGYSAEHFSNLFNSKAFQGSVGPSFQWNLLNYGRILNNVKLQEARFWEQVTRYQSTVLQANEEVENGIVTFLRSQQIAKELAVSVDAAQKAVKIAAAQYEGGTIDFNRVAVLEQNLVTQQNQYAQAQGQIAQGLIQVYRALGGGWQIRCDGCESSTTIVGQAMPASPKP